MRIANTFLTGTLVLALLAGCKKETDPRVPPSMSFRTGSGYTSGNDTVPPADTLLIGVVIDKTEDPLIALNVSVAYDGAGSSTVENLSISGEHVEHDQQVITRAEAGSEEWIFSVTDRDGNITTRSLTLTVQ
ncbi:MAG: hypothetical protein R2810_16025 [Flavobacteriales bacterium]|nr:hypothetical protein [Flavobacteriales bacterium]MCB0817388.1 hypothetical protein [Flavobacteriales bacterium]